MAAAAAVVAGFICSLKRSHGYHINRRG